LRAGPLEFRVSACSVWSYPFKLKLDCWRSERELDCDVYFAPDCIDAKSVQRFIANLQTLLGSAATNLDAPLEQLSLLSTTERQQLADLNETQAELSRLSVIERFESQVQLTPSRTAVVFKDQQLTYEQLNSKANQVAHYLRGLGVGPDVAVGLCVDRSLEMLIGMLGIMKAGGAYVPLNPEHPAARLSFQIAETGASVLLTNLASKPALDNPALKIVALDSPPAEFQAAPSHNPGVAISLANLCYVIYTSGSTGNPKGVAVTHEGLANYTEFIVKKLQTAENRPLHYATVSTFTADLGNTSIFPCLTSGGCLHVIPFDVVTDGRSFAAYNESEPIDVLKIVPSHFEALLAAAENVLPREFLIFGGEALSPQLLKRLRDEQAQCRIINHYGPTETTVGSLTFDCAEFEEAGTVPIGGPIANTQAYILDRALNPAPFTVAGDLYLAGAGVARGYINQQATTADRFVADPFSRTPGARMYRTGDRARYLANGRIEFLGRSDRQLKMRGFRIEPEEIETLLGQYPAIQRCVVAPLQRADGEPRLVAYVVSAQIVTADELRAWLRSKLPDYLIPSQFITLKVLPLTRNGKVDYTALAEIAEHESLTGRPMVAPRTELEEKLAAMWCELLKLEAVGVTDNFFELGGHSLLATQVVSRIRKFFCVELSLPGFFEGPTIEQLAVKVESAKAEQTNRLLRQLEHMSDEEAQRLLKADS
jgi:amino acid adenylation domain-containing protein